MKYLLILLFPFAANSQVIADTSYFGTSPNWIKVVSYRNASTSIVATQSRLNDTSLAIRARLETKAASTHTHTDKVNVSDTAAMLNNYKGKEPAITTLSFAKGGQSGTATAGATTGTIAVTMGSSIISITPTGACTFTSNAGVTGQRCSFIVTTSGASSFVLTWGTGFKAVSTLATGTVTAKTFVVSFIFTGSLWVETSRTAAQ